MLKTLSLPASDVINHPFLSKRHRHIPPSWIADIPGAERARMFDRLYFLMQRLSWDSLPQNVCYLLHLHTPMRPKEKPESTREAQHYLGTSKQIMQRLSEHFLGLGARFTQLARPLGWTLVRLWAGGREMEKILKGWSYKLLCPVCSGDAAWGRGTHQYKRRYVKRNAGFWTAKRAAAEARRHERELAALCCC